MINALYRKILLIRKFEERVLHLFDQGQLSGTTHTCIGQEANAVGITSVLSDDDIIVSNHRCHGHYLARTGDANGLMAELMGRCTGICSGRGGSQHLCRNGGFFTNGIQGGIVPFATGIALAEKLKKSGKLVVVFMGDGTLGQGVVYESLNIASLWDIPLLFVVENNRYAQSTHVETACSGSMIERGRAFGIESGEIETNDVNVIYSVFQEIAKHVREKRRPYFQVIHTYRLSPHSKGDDFRCEKEIENWREKDPLKIIESQITDNVREEIMEEVLLRIENAEREALNAPFSEDLG